jgi:small subunit ribosomal protein S11
MMEETQTTEEVVVETPATEAPVEEAASKGRRRKTLRQVRFGQAHVQASYNNTIVTLTDLNGNVLSWSSAGRVGFRGPKKSTPYAAGIIVKDAVEKAKGYGLQEVNVFVKGVGSGREAAIRALHANGINVLAIRDITPIPHNGCRAPRPRRV